MRADCVALHVLETLAGIDVASANVQRGVRYPETPVLIRRRRTSCFSLRPLKNAAAVSAHPSKAETCQTAQGEQA